MTAGTLARVGLLLADKQPGDDTGGQGPDFGKASPVALLVILLLLIAIVLLVRSMTKHLKRAHANLDPDESEQGSEAGEGAQTDAQGAGGQQAADTGQADEPSRQDGETLPRGGAGDSEAEHLR